VKGSGTIPTLLMFVVIVLTSLLIFLVLPNMISIWNASCDVVSQTISTITLQNVKNACTKSPVQIEVVIKPEYLPLTSDHALRSLLQTTDEGSGKTVQELLAYAVENKKATFSLDGKSIDVEKVVDKEMNSLLPDRQYNLVVKSGLLNFGNQNLNELYQISQGLGNSDIKPSQASHLSCTNYYKGTCQTACKGDEKDIGTADCSQSGTGGGAVCCVKKSGNIYHSSTTLTTPSLNKIQIVLFVR
jgi:hypothetical protein